MSGSRSTGTALGRRLVPARWAAAYLALSAALIAVAGREMTGPGASERARRVEADAAAQLAELARTASAVADAWECDRARREAERASLLDSALAASVSWATELVTGTHVTDGMARPDALDPERPVYPADAFTAAAAELAPVLPDGVAVAVIAPDGNSILEFGGEIDPDSAGALLAPVAEGFTVAVAWTEPLPARDEEATRTIRGSLARGADPGVGLYFVAPDGTTPVEISQRPVPDSPAAQALSGGLGEELAPDGTCADVTGDLETGKLVRVRCPVGRLGWTAVAERFVSAEELGGRDGEASGAIGMIALTALGLVAAAAFAHAVRSALSRTENETEEAQARAERFARPLRPRAARRAPIAAAGEHVQAEPEPMPTGGSIPRLREALGTSGEGPDLGASARSPILRALSRYVRAPVPPRLPSEVGSWGKSVEEQAGGSRGLRATNQRR